MKNLRSPGLVAAALLVSLAGCKKDGIGGDAVAGLPAEMQPRPAHGDPQKLAMPAVLAYVPSDTPYLIAGVEAMPPALFDRLAQAFAPLASLVSSTWQRERASNKLLDAIASELDGKWNAAGLESLGLSTEPRFAVYGLGLQPVVARIAIKDDKVVRATIERIAAKAGEALPALATKDGRSYWRHDTADGASVVLALADNQAIFAAGKTADVDAKLRLILGLDKPAHNMADGALLKQLMARHGLGGQTIAFVDVRQLVGQALAAAGAAPSPACTTEIDQLSAKLPRVVLGYGELSTARISSGLVVELAPDVVAGLRSIKTEIPGLAAVLSGHPLLAFAAGADLGKAQQLGVAAAGRLQQLGTACTLGPLVDGAARAAAALGRPLPEPAGQIAGGVMVVDDIGFPAGDPHAQMPDKIDGMLLIASPDARALFTRASSLAPPIQQLGIAADGKLHPVTVPMPMPVALAAGVGDRAIVVTAGDKRRAVAEQQLAAHGGDKAPLLAVSYQVGKLMDLAIQHGSLASASAAAPEMLPFMQQLNKLFGQLSLTVDVTDQGLAFWSTVDLN